MQVIGLDPVADQRPKQTFQCGGIGIDAAQQHRLRQQRDAGIGQSRQRRTGIGCQFLRMVGVQHHPDRQPPRPQRGQHRAVDPVRRHHRHTGVKAHQIQMRDVLQPRHQRRDAPGRKHHRIAAGQDNLVNGRGAGDIVQRRAQLFGGQGAFVANHLTSKTEPAIDLAIAGHVQDHPIGIAMGQAGHRAVRQVADRIGQFLGADVQFARVGDELRGNAVAGRLDRPTHGGGDTDAELGRDLFQRLPLVCGRKSGGDKVRDRGQGRAVQAGLGSGKVGLIHRPGRHGKGITGIGPVVPTALPPCPSRRGNPWLRVPAGFAGPSAWRARHSGWCRRLRGSARYGPP